MLNILCHDATTLVSLENGFQCFKYVLQSRVIYLKGIDQKTVERGHGAYEKSFNL